jgi:hypothetical protein
MYKQVVELDEKELLYAQWGKEFTHITIKLDGKIIGTYEDSVHLRDRGIDIYLEDGRIFTPIIADGRFGIWHNGIDLMTGLEIGTTDDFVQAFRWIYGIIGFRFAFGLFCAFIAFSRNQELGLEILIDQLITNGLLLGLAFWAQKSFSKIPLILALVIVALLTILIMYQGAFIGIIFNAVLIYYLIAGISAEPIHRPKWEEDSDTLDGEML